MRDYDDELDGNSAAANLRNNSFFIVVGALIVGVLIAYPLYQENVKFENRAADCHLRSATIEITGAQLSLTRGAFYQDTPEKEVLKAVGCDLHGANLTCELSGCPYG